MIIKSLKLRNYRNYSDAEIQLSDKLNIFIGDNAQGKSNILESIVVLALTKSYMNVKDKYLIKNDCEVASVSAKVNLGSKIEKLFISFDENIKKVKVDNVLIKKYNVQEQ